MRIFRPFAFAVACVCFAADVSVLVVDADSGHRVPGTTVLLESDTGTRESATEANGEVLFADLPLGAYRLRLEKAGYIDLEEAHRRRRGRLIVVKRSEGARSIVGVVRHAVVSGRVTDGRGQPLSGMGVFAVRQAGNGEIDAVRFDAPVVTDDGGRYRLHHLPPGMYTFAAVPSGDIAENEWRGPVYYANHRDFSRAQFVELSSGAELGSMDITVTWGQTGSIAGSVSGIDDQWEAGSVAVAVLPAGALRTPVALAVAGTSGRFRFDGIPAGDYRLAAWGPVRGADTSAPPPSADEGRYGSRAMSVRGGEVASSDLTLSRPVRLETRFGDADGCAGVASITVHAQGDWPEWWTFPSRETADGAIWDLPRGAYRIDVPDLERGCVFAGLRGERERNATRKAIDLSAPVVASVVAMRAAAGVSGVVRANGRAVAGRIVGLWPGDGGGVPMFAETDRAGLFTFEHVPPGSYSIGAVGRERKAVRVEGSGSVRVDMDLSEEGGR